MSGNQAKKLNDMLTKLRGSSSSVTVMGDDDKEVMEWNRQASNKFRQPIVVTYPTNRKLLNPEKGTWYTVYKTEKVPEVMKITGEPLGHDRYRYTVHFATPDDGQPTEDGVTVLSMDRRLNKPFKPSDINWDENGCATFLVSKMPVKPEKLEDEHEQKHMAGQ